MSRFKQNVRLFSLILVFVSLSLSPLYAQEESSAVTDDDVNRVASQLFCPTCESVPVDVCPTEVCTDWRHEIRRQLAEGKSDQEILSYFAIRYGNGVLANPRAEGFGLLIWATSAFVLLAGGLGFGRYIYQLKKTQETLPTPPKSPPTQAAPDSYRQQIEKEIDNL